MSKILNNTKRIISICTAKLAIFFGKLLGKKGSSTPGSIAMKIYGGVLSDLAKQVKKETIFICGTNGKTTTSNLLYSLIKSSGKNVICNNVGANMLPGVACAYVNGASLTGKINADYAVIECDEASLRHIVKHVKPDKIIITNLFRDQLDRYGEIDITIKLLSEAFDYLKNDFELILNADDPLSAYFGTKYKAVYYGISEESNLKTNEIKEGRFCLCCGNELTYNYYHYSQLGNYFCKNCGFKRPDPDYSAVNIDLDGGMKFDIDFKGRSIHLDLNYKGFYNIYNVLAAFGAYESLNLNLGIITDVFNAYKPQIGRMETFTINGKQVVFNLSKNPAGFNQAIATLIDDKSEKDVFIVINDNAQDGKDISWIWDVDFELLKDANINLLYAGGIRKNDLALRLKYGGFTDINILDNTKENLKKIFYASKRTCYVLVNYTALFSTQTNLLELSKEDNESDADKKEDNNEN